MILQLSENFIRISGSVLPASFKYICSPTSLHAKTIQSVQGPVGNHESQFQSYIQSARCDSIQFAVSHHFHSDIRAFGSGGGVNIDSVRAWL
jgi:hypothetical protein